MLFRSLAQLCHEQRPCRRGQTPGAGPQFEEGRWAHTVILAGGYPIHFFNVYGWPEGTPGRAHKQSGLWVELFGHVAGLGGAPWLAGGDWNAKPEAMASGRQPTRRGISGGTRGPAADLFPPVG